MKLSNLTAKLTVLKSTTARALAMATLAGAALISVAPAAQAQRFVVRAQIGTPRYFAPAPRYFAPEPPVVVYAPPAYVYGNEYRRSDAWRFRHEPVRRDDWRR
jgi:hypothetical protein